MTGGGTPTMTPMLICAPAVPLRHAAVVAINASAAILDLTTFLLSYETGAVTTPAHNGKARHKRAERTEPTMGASRATWRKTKPAMPCQFEAEVSRRALRMFVKEPHLSEPRMPTCHAAVAMEKLR
jgi:hypothetical protein